MKAPPVSLSNLYYCCLDRRFREDLVAVLGDDEGTLKPHPAHPGLVYDERGHFGHVGLEHEVREFLAAGYCRVPLVPDDSDAVPERRQLSRGDLCEELCHNSVKDDVRNDAILLGVSAFGTDSV